MAAAESDFLPDVLDANADHCYSAIVEGVEELLYRTELQSSA